MSNGTPQCTEALNREPLPTSPRRAEVLLFTEAMLFFSIVALGYVENYNALLAVQISCYFFAGTTSLLKSYVPLSPQNGRNSGVWA